MNKSYELCYLPMRFATTKNYSRKALQLILFGDTSTRDIRDIKKRLSFLCRCCEETAASTVYVFTQFNKVGFILDFETLLELI